MQMFTDNDIQKLTKYSKTQSLKKTTEGPDSRPQTKSL